MALPNIRRLYIPDPGHTIWDMDLDSADLRIVAWESDCQQVKQWFREGKKPYIELMKEYYKDQSITKHHPSYKLFKSLCHGSNYLGKAKNIAPRIGLLVHETEKLQKWYFDVCPEIPAWQNRLIEQLKRTRTVKNAFGYQRIFMTRIGGNVFNEAVAWIPQSTVGILINHAWDAIDENLPDVSVLCQVHDSLVGQYPTSRPELKDQILVQSTIPVPYPDPLIIPVGLTTSDKSWGDCG